MASRPRAAPRTVIPVLPLAITRKHHAKAAAAAALREKAKVIQPVEPVEIEEPSPAPPAETSSPSTLSEDSPTPTLNESQDAEVSHKDGVAQPAFSTPSAAAVVSVQNVSQDKVQVLEAAAEGQVQAESQRQAVTSEASNPSDSMSSASRATFQMPPAFVPQNPMQSSIPELGRFAPPPPFCLQNHMHHAHPSGSMMFSPHAESSSSSPAPPSGGNVPPYQFPQAGYQGSGRYGPQQSNGSHHHGINGFSPMNQLFPTGNYRQDSFSGPVNGYSRHQMMQYAPAESYTPSATPQVAEIPQMNGYATAVPHSIHGSQSSILNEQDGPPFYSQYPTVTGGSNGHIEDARVYQYTRPKPSHQGFPMSNMPPIDTYDGLVPYLQGQFADEDLADSVLELRYSDDRAEPVRIPGHRLILARSPALKQLISEVDKSSMEGRRTLLMLSEDRFLRSDGFWMAVQRLYGGALLDMGTMGQPDFPMSAPGSFSRMPGTPAERFDFSLGYSAAGKELGVNTVLNRGIEMASSLVNWATLEKALEFSLDGGLDQSWSTEGFQKPQTHSPSTYGSHVNMLIHSALSFIISNFPPTFELDFLAPEPIHNRRIPVVPEDQSLVHSAKLSMIRFGDHPTEESTRAAVPNPINNLLSKILLSLPFHLLKYVLESPRLGNVQGWATSALRQNTMYRVVGEREKRRLKAHSSVNVSNEERRHYSKTWEVVGWEERVTPNEKNEEMLTLTRTWVDFITS